VERASKGGKGDTLFMKIWSKIDRQEKFGSFTHKPLVKMRNPVHHRGWLH